MTPRPSVGLLLRASTRTTADDALRHLEALADTADAKLLITESSQPDLARRVKDARDDVTVATVEPSLSDGSILAAGFEQLNTDLVAIVRPETVLPDGWVDGLVSHLEHDLIAVGPRIAGAPGDQGLMLRAAAAPGSSLQTRWLHPAVIVMSRAGVQQLGGIDPGVGDAWPWDLSWRLRATGGRLIVAVDVEGDLRDPAVSGHGDGIDAVAGKMLRHYGRGAIPSRMALFGDVPFEPAGDPWLPIQRRYAIDPDWEDAKALVQLVRRLPDVVHPLAPVEVLVGVPSGQAGHAHSRWDQAVLGAGLPPTALDQTQLVPHAVLGDLERLAI